MNRFRISERELVRLLALTSRGIGQTYRGEDTTRTKAETEVLLRGLGLDPDRVADLVADEIDALAFPRRGPN